MNERIKELYEQAHDAEKVWLLPESLQEVGREGEVKTFNPEKFAELIVKECADRCLAMAYVNPGPHHYAAMIKEHFGVE